MVLHIECFLCLLSDNFSGIFNLLHRLQHRLLFLHKDHNCDYEWTECGLVFRPHEPHAPAPLSRDCHGQVGCIIVVVGLRQKVFNLCLYIDAKFYSVISRDLHMHFGRKKADLV